MKGPKNEIKLQEWVLNNNINFPSFIDKSFTGKYKGESPFGLFEHQRIINDILQHSSPYRGLMVYHGLGVGKTRTAIITAETLSSNLDIVVMLPASIEQNFINEIVKCSVDEFSSEGKWKKEGKSWVKSKAEGSKIFSSLSQEDKSAINKQIQDKVKQKYTFIHYNGLTKKNIAPYNSEFFNNKIIIIDEVHNFISRVMNNSTIAKAIYQSIMSSVTSKLLLLSGTPIINKPFEMALLINLVKGQIPTISINFKTADIIKISEKMQTDPIGKYIDFIKVDSPKKTITIIPMPVGFIKNKESLAERSTKAEPLKIEGIIELIKKNIKNISKITTSETTLFPTNEDKFNELFIEETDEKTMIKNENLLSRRLTGLVSHFEFYDPEKYPTLNEIKYEYVEMQDHHFTKYMTLRQKEFEMESKAKKRKALDNGGGNSKDSSNTVYRAFSRAVCNFSFPEKIKRVYPYSIRQMQKEAAVSEEDGYSEGKEEVEEDKDKDGNVKVVSNYKEIIDSALDALYTGKKDYLTGEGLKTYGPKYHKAYKHISGSIGPVMMYSQFRNVEGLKIMELVLKTHEYVELNIKKDKKTNAWKFTTKKADLQKEKYIIFTDDKQKNKILMDIFNSDFDIVPVELLDDLKQMLSEEDQPDMNLHGKIAKVIMITQSGAEGISLKNVRQVHILEPYWNNIRVKQVIGRAVRAGSHLRLPKSERIVDVFMYLTKFTKKQNEDAVVKTREKNITTDEYVFGIAKRKANIIESLQSIMQKSAIDCTFHKNKSCFKLASNIKSFTGRDHLYINKIEEDYKDNTTKVVEKIKIEKIVRKIKFITITDKMKNKIKIPYDVTTKEVYNPDKYALKEFVVIGTVIEDENGKKRVNPIKP